MRQCWNGIAVSGIAVVDSVLWHVPLPLLRQLVEGLWLPVVGAGFSRNCSVASGDLPPDWKKLGALLAEDLAGLEYDGPLDAVSAYQQAFGRAALVDRVASLLRVHDAQPGAAHRSFARLGFQNVITTNVDLLLEKAYDSVQRVCLPLVDESQLSNRYSYPGPRLLKLHGDVHHPHRLVLTEDDYDGFLTEHPLLATSLGALLIDHTAVLIGYSLDDPDMRQLLQVARNRLGRLAPPVWAIQIESPQHVVNRFERRGVRVISLPQQRGKSHGEQLAEFFDALREHWEAELLGSSQSTDERALADLQLPPRSSRICYFAVPLELLSWYREVIFPIVERSGFVPLAPWDVETPPATVATKIAALIDRAALVIVEITGRNVLYELGLAVSRHLPNSVLLISDETVPAGVFDAGIRVIRRPWDLNAAAELLGKSIARWLEENAAATAPADGESEPERLLTAGQYRAALIAAISLLETSLSRRLDEWHASGRRSPMSQVIDRAVRSGLIEEIESGQLNEAIRLRNAALHQNAHVTERQAREAVTAIMTIVRRIDSPAR